ncbi:DUF2380 domain-containing protein [Azospirillum sp. A39]|uniref:DUF2380 domain-containing protein n=1 Tax=Azospirillum sp. A39 TaxID=3462279 RepID=UPI004045C7EA
MRRFPSAADILVIAVLVLGAHGARAGSPEPRTGLAVVDFVYVDTSGEPGDQEAVHRRRLRTFMAALRRDLVADGRLRLVPVRCGAAACREDDPVPADLRRAAADGGARLLVMGGIHKLSTLVQWAQVRVVDVDTDRIVLDRLLTFRGDSDQAWARAEAFIARDILAELTDRGVMDHE